MQRRKLDLELAELYIERTVKYSDTLWSGLHPKFNHTNGISMFSSCGNVHEVFAKHYLTLRIAVYFQAGWG